ncbi:MAG: restriction endonuclease subunit S [Pseudomonadales bacterium]|nr:restriction endonuclease subunit S [Pseudomonadales bacterium]
MGGEWNQVIFSQLCDITRGASPRPIHDWFAESGIPWVKISDANSAQSRYITETGQYIKPEGRHRSVVVNPGDLILSNSATPGIPKFMGIYACIHDGWLLLRNLRNLDKQFAYYLLLHERPKLVAQGNGSVFTNLKTEILKNHLVNLPPVSEQRAIAHILGTLDDKIELNRRRNQTLEAMARALFKDWFVDFGPVRAKMEGRARQDGARSGQPRTPKASDLPWPGAEAGAGAQGEPYLPADLWQLFPDRLDDEGKPEGWEMAPLSAFASLVTTSVSPNKSPEETFEHYSIPAFDAGRMPVMDLGESIKSNKYIVHADAVLVSKLNPQTPRIWLPTISTDRAICSTEFMQFVPLDSENRPFLFCLMDSMPMQEEVLRHVTGSTGSRQRAQPSQIAKVDVLIPKSDILTTFNRQVAPILRAVADNQRESRTLAQLRDTLLPKLISGELRIEDVERFMEGALA